MFPSLKNCDLSQVSLTGIRSLVLLGLLIDAPRSLEEIKEIFVRKGIMDESNSYDILRIDINTLRTMGCKITRAGQSTDYKYKLLRHPFELELNDDELNTIKRAYNKIKDGLSLDELIAYDILLKKLSEHVGEEVPREKLRGISSLKRYKIEHIQELQEDCKWNRTLTLSYYSPVSKKSSDKTIIAKQIAVKNDKVYLYGYDLNLKEAVTLNLKRILKIISRKDGDGGITITPIKIKFKLTSFTAAGLDDNENIISGDFQQGFIIEGSYHNEFLAMQRILSFGSDCTVLSPADFKEKIITSLKEMREIYNE